MGQKANPTGNRLGFIHGWKSLWFAPDKKTYARYVYEDWFIRTYIKKRFVNAGIADIYIERPQVGNSVNIIIETSRPGIIIGRGGIEIEKLTQELKYLLKADSLQIWIKEVKRPEIEPAIIFENLANLIKNGVSYRRAINEVMEEAMRAGAKGIKIFISGRLAGAELARTEKFVMGRVPVSTLRADIDYYVDSFLTKLGLIGVKIWVYKGDVLGKRNLFLEFYDFKSPKGR